MKLFDIPESYPRRLYRAGAMLTLIAGLAAAGMGLTPLGTVPRLRYLSACCWRRCSTPCSYGSRCLARKYWSADRQRSRVTVTN